MSRVDLNQYIFMFVYQSYTLFIFGPVFTVFRLVYFNFANDLIVDSFDLEAVGWNLVSLSENPALAYVSHSKIYKILLW